MKAIIMIFAMVAYAACYAAGEPSGISTNIVSVTMRVNGKERKMAGRAVSFHELEKKHGKRVSIERYRNVVTWGFEDGHKVTIPLPPSYVLDVTKCAGVNRSKLESLKKKAEEGGAK